MNKKLKSIFSNPAMGDVVVFVAACLLALLVMIVPAHADGYFSNGYGGGYVQPVGYGGYGSEATRPSSHSSDRYAAGEALRQGDVFQGTILAARDVTIQGSASAKLVGTAAGAGIGGVIASRVGKGNGKTVATVLGAILGGAVGNEIADGVSMELAQEVVVKMEDGRKIAVTQAIGHVPLARGDTVFVTRTNTGNYRVWANN